MHQLLAMLGWARLLDVDRSELAAIVRLVVVHTGAVERYEPGAIDVPTWLFVAQDDLGREDLMSGWRRSASRLEPVLVPGTHDTNGPFVSTVARRLRTVLEACDRNAGVEA